MKKAVKKPISKAALSKAGDGRARHHQKARQDRASEIAQDYVEVIADLIEEKGEARVLDIARLLGVSHVTVNRTIRRLQRDELVKAEKYSAVFLTKNGLQLATEVKHRHSIVERFLEALGVKSTTARDDAEGIEHHVSKETLQAFERFLEKAK